MNLFISVQCSLRPEEDTRSLEAGVIGGSKPSDNGTDNRPQFHRRKQTVRVLDIAPDVVTEVRFES